MRFMSLFHESFLRTYEKHAKVQLNRHDPVNLVGRNLTCAYIETRVGRKLALWNCPSESSIILYSVDSYQISEG